MKRLYSLRGWTLLSLFFVVSATAPVWADPSIVRDLIELSCYIGLAISWNLLAGYGGMVSVGQQAFLGIGAYAAFSAINLAGGGLVTALLSAIVAASLAAVILAPLLFKLQGGYFAIGSWVAAEVFRLVISDSAALGGSSGLSLHWNDGLGAEERNKIILWTALVLVFGVQIVIVRVLRSPLGLALSALRDNAQAAESQGVPVIKVRRIVFIASAMAFGLFGALYYLVSLRVSPDGAFDVRWTVLVIFMVVIGGVGSIEGPLIGAVLFFTLDRWFSEYGTSWLIALGTLAVVCAVAQRGGLWALFERIAGRPLTFFPARWH